MAALVCRTCATQHPINEPIWRCVCGGLLDLEFTSEFPKKKIDERRRDIWRYREAIPIDDDDNIVNLGEGVTLSSRPMFKVFPFS